MPQTLQQQYKELCELPKFQYGFGKSQSELDALKQVDALIALAEKVRKLNQMPGQSNAGIDDAFLSLCLTESLNYACRTHFDLALGSSDPGIWVGRSKEFILESLLKHPGADAHLVRCIEYLTRILNDDLRDEIVYRNIYVILLITCYRAIGSNDLALKNALEFAETKTADSLILLSQCYCDAEKIDLAIQTATEAILSSAKNTTDELGAWRNRAGIYSKIGKDLEASRDTQHANKLKALLEQRFSK